jgi:hypothetical protein
MGGDDDVGTYSGSADLFFTVIAVTGKGDAAVAVSTDEAGETARKTVGATLLALLARYGRPPR